jgi:hypothetical protein
MNIMKFQKATKFESHLKLGLSGPPGSGKSYTALTIASYLSEKGIAVIDAESGAASKYASLFHFDMLDLTVDENGKEVSKPFTPLRYIEAMQAAYESGEYDVLIVDGISPEWDDAGGCLQTVDELTRRNRTAGEKSATRDAWSVVTPHHKNFVNYILRVKMHVICTMLAKKEEVITKDAQGRITDRKKTLEPVQREDVPRVFDIFAKMEERDMIIDKTRCPELDGQIYHKPGQEVANIIREWLKGEPLPERLVYAPDLDERHRIVDAPVDRSTPANDSNGNERRPIATVRTATVASNGQTKGTTTEENEASTLATDQQLASIRKLRQHLGKTEPDQPDTLSYQDAKALITQLSHEYNEQKQQRKAS